MTINQAPFSCLLNTPCERVQVSAAEQRRPRWTDRQLLSSTPPPLRPPASCTLLQTRTGKMDRVCDIRCRSKHNLGEADVQYLGFILASGRPLQLLQKPSGVFEAGRSREQRERSQTGSQQTAALSCGGPAGSRAANCVGRRRLFSP